jgi:2-polyprenyl-3-methyl-5-hydroxy-6-metoxy-1,4-benzoquinol methylase
MILEPERRYVQWMQRGLVKGGFQPNNATFEDRYPRIFDFVRSLYPGDRPLNILSFGCSTGEEVFSLRRRFPEATVRGLDINPGNIRISLRRQRERAVAAVSFARADSTEGERASSYDVIFCMAVLRDSRLSERRIEDCRRFIRFEDFEAVVTDFCRCLKPDGILAMIHSNFRLCDTSIADQFEVVFRRPLPPHAASPIYGRDNRLVDGLANPDAVFRKLGVPGG